MNTSNDATMTKASSRLAALFLGLTVASSAIAPQAMAQGRVYAPAYTPQAEVADSQMELRDDRRDLMRLSAAVNQWNRSLRTGNLNQELTADAQIRSWLHQEMIESRQEALEAQHEAAVSRIDNRVAASQAAQAHSYGQPVSPHYQATAAAAQDDRIDAREKMQQAKRTKQLYHELSAMQPYFQARTTTPSMVNRKAQIYRQLQGDALAELGEDREELMEDSIAMGASYPTRPPSPPMRRKTR